MKYYLYRQQKKKNLEYPYWAMIADEPIEKFGCGGPKKSFNCNLYTELQVLDIIRAAYPDAIRIPMPTSKRWQHKNYR
jgi:hypothetical protein